MQAQVLDIRERLLGANHPDTLGSVNDLSLTLSYCGKWKEAEELQLQVLKIQKGGSRAEHPLTLISINNLAAIFSG